jgi:hypothetical protein
MTHTTVVDAARTEIEPSPFSVNLRPAATWTSWEGLRRFGGQGMAASIQPGTVGFVEVKGARFCILRDADFQRVLGLAQDVQRMSEGVLLFRHAAELAYKTPDKDLGLKVLREMTMHYELPAVGQQRWDLVVVPDEERDTSTEDFDASTFVPPRPAWKG